MLADLKTKSCRALIAFRFLKLNLFIRKFGKLIMETDFMKCFFLTWVRAAITMDLRRVVAPLPRLSWRLRNGFWDFERESAGRCGQALHRRFLFV